MGGGCSEAQSGTMQRLVVAEQFILYLCVRYLGHDQSNYRYSQGRILLASPSKTQKKSSRCDTVLSCRVVNLRRLGTCWVGRGLLLSTIRLANYPISRCIPCRYLGMCSRRRSLLLPSLDFPCKHSTFCNSQIHHPRPRFPDYLTPFPSSVGSYRRLTFLALGSERLPGPTFRPYRDGNTALAVAVGS